MSKYNNCGQPSISRASRSSFADGIYKSTLTENMSVDMVEDGQVTILLLNNTLTVVTCIPKFSLDGFYFSLSFVAFYDLIYLLFLNKHLISYMKFPRWCSRMKLRNPVLSRSIVQRTLYVEYYKDLRQSSCPSDLCNCLKNTKNKLSN